MKTDFQSLLEMLANLEQLADLTKDKASAKRTEKALDAVLSDPYAPPAGGLARCATPGAELQWGAEVKAYCQDARRRVREQLDDERQQAALEAAERLVEQTILIAKRRKRTSDCEVMSETAKHVTEFKTLYEDSDSTDRDDATSELDAFFEGIHERATITLFEIKRHRKLTASEIAIGRALSALSTTPDRFRQNEAAQKLALLQKALQKVRA